MKQTEISRIMDEYTDGDLFFDGESDIDSEAVKSRVLDKIQAETRTDVQTAKPKGLKKPLKIFIAAAAAVCCLSAAALAVGLPYTHTTIVTKSEITLTTDKMGNRSMKVEKGNPPFEYRDGRIIFTAFEEEKDITDLIDDETPYICSYIYEETGLEAYIAVGGNPGHTGFTEIVNIGTAEEPYWLGTSWFAKYSEFIVYGVDLEFIGLSHEQKWELYDSDLSHYSEKGYTKEMWEERFVNHCSVFGKFDRVMPWAQRVVEELNLFEAKERMCAEYEFEQSDTDFVEIVLHNSAIYGVEGSYEWDTVENFEKAQPEIDTSIAYSSPAEVRDGRLWLTVNGEEKDITDLIDENTPYIEEVENSFYRTWIIVGGTPENYGCTQLVNTEDLTNGDWRSSFGSIDHMYSVIAFGDKPNGYVFTVDGEEITYEQLVEYLKQGVDLNGRFDCMDTTPEWFKAACKELALEYHVRYVEK